MPLKKILIFSLFLLSLNASANSINKRFVNKNKRPKLIIGGSSSIFTNYFTDYNKNLKGENINLSNFISPNYNFYVGTYINNSDIRLEGHFSQKLLNQASSITYKRGYPSVGETKFTMDLESTVASMDILWDLSLRRDRGSLLIGAGVAHSSFKIRDFHENTYYYSYHNYSSMNPSTHHNGNSDNSFSLKVIAGLGFKFTSNLAFTTRFEAYLGNTLYLKNRNGRTQRVSLNPVETKLGLEYNI